MDPQDAELNKMVGDILSEGLPAWPPATPPPGGWPEVAPPPPQEGDEWKDGS